MLLHMENDQLHARHVPRIQRSAIIQIHDTHGTSIFFAINPRDIYNPRNMCSFNRGQISCLPDFRFGETRILLDKDLADITCQTSPMLICYLYLPTVRTNHLGHFSAITWLILTRFNVDSLIFIYSRSRYLLQEQPSFFEKCGFPMIVIDYITYNVSR